MSISTPTAAAVTTLRADGTTVQFRVHPANTQVVSLSIASTGVEVVLRVPSTMMYASNPPRPAPDKVWKEIYAVVQSPPLGEDCGLPVLQLIDTIPGDHVPAYQVAEQIVFPSETP